MLRKTVFVEFVFLICIASASSLANSIYSRTAELLAVPIPNMIRSIDDFMKSGSISSHLLPRGEKRKTSSKMSNIPSSSKSHEVRSGSALQQIQSKKSPSPSPASSGSMSKSSKWSGSGFTDSESPSSWGSWQRNPVHSPTNAKIWTKGSAVVRTRTMASKRRDFMEVDSKMTRAKELQDPQKTQAAVNVLSHKGNAGVSAFGRHSTARVDARKSKHGGWLSRINSSGQTDDVVHVPPGTKAKYSVRYFGQGHGTRAFVQGKGTVKVNGNNVWPSHTQLPRFGVYSPRTSAASGSDYGPDSDSESVSQSH